MYSELDMNIIVPASDLKKIKTASIGVPGEPGDYIAGLSVYHELHCLVSLRILNVRSHKKDAADIKHEKRLRQHTWLDHYFPNQTAEDARLQRLHTGKKASKRNRVIID